MNQFLLKQINKNVKFRVVEMYKNSNAGHVGVSFSACEISVFIHFSVMNKGDEFILSKGHAAALLYSILAEKGILTEHDIKSFYQNNTYLAAHPPGGKIEGIPFATGSLGHGLSLAAGMGLANKLKKNQKNIYCLTADGELNEGSNWEAALFIAHHNLTNVIWIIDRNKIQGFGRTEDVMKIEPLNEKLTSFGFKVHEIINGHDFGEMEKVKLNLSNIKPNVIIAHTTKGKGWNRLENTVDCHYVPMNEADYQQIKNSL